MIGGAEDDRYIRLLRQLPAHPFRRQGLACCGFELANPLVCPDLIKPGEWLPVVWSRDSVDPEPAFDNLDHVNRVLGLIMGTLQWRRTHTDGMPRPLQPAVPRRRAQRRHPLGTLDRGLREGPSSYGRQLGKDSSTPMPTRRRRCAE